MDNVGFEIRDRDRDDDDIDNANEYDQQSYSLLQNIAQMEDQYRQGNSPPPNEHIKYRDLRIKLRESYVDSLYEKLSKYLKYKVNHKDYNLFNLDDNGLIYKDDDDVKVLVKKDKQLKSIKTIVIDLGVGRLKKLGFENVTSKNFKSLPTREEISKATPKETIEMVDIAGSEVREKISTVETSFTEDEGTFTKRELKGLNKAMQTLSGSLKKAVAEKTKTEIHIDMEYGKLKELKKDLTATDEEREEIHDRITKLKDRLQAHNDEIKILKDKFSSQVTQIKETFKKLMDKDKTVGEKIRILFREQGITITTLLTAIGMTIGFLVELLTPASVSITPSPSPSPDKSWIKKKLEALKNLLGKLAAKAGAALPGIIGSIVSWILNRVKDVVGFIAKETWILIVGIGLFLINSIRK